MQNDDDYLSHMQAAKERDEESDRQVIPSNFRPAYRIVPIYAAVDAFWDHWRKNGETHKHGFYESTWGAINAALSVAGVRYANKNESAISERKDLAADIKPIGWISEKTREWLKDHQARGPGLFVPNRNGQTGIWPIYSGEDLKELFQYSEKYERLRENFLRVIDCAKRLYEESEEYDFPEGMGKGALQQYWDDLDSALECLQDRTEKEDAHD